MAIYRNVHLSFWTDNKVVDDFTPEDKYFYLYLFTNPQTNLIGCYEVSIITMANQTGYGKETILRLLDRFENVHKVIKYSKETKEILILNWSRYNWTNSPKLDKPLQDGIKQVKNLEFTRILTDLYNNRDTVSIPYRYGMDTTDTVYIYNNINNNKNNKDIKIYTEIIDYLNNKTGKKFSIKAKDTKRHINARLDDGFTIDDFKKVIDNKVKQWGNDKEMSKYLRPMTLFGTKFESYLNEGNSSNGYTEDDLKHLFDD